ncbi:hypothetical protein [Trichormus sp. NMC-1]|uniref:hypothetical protein n=1 Tax=Trichormus sp. NMC-1 TaxID=1853259 RepID=UPI0008DC130D|nr:hypothetical protein [Trichormus sp. NMC-1]
MLTTIAKRIQSRLSRQGLKVSLGEIKSQCEQMIADVENATETDILAVTEYFISNATKLTVISEDTATEQTEVEETSICVGGELGNIAEPTQTELETLTTEDVDIVNSVDNAINTASIQDIDSNDLHTNEAALDTENQTALATATKSELVSSTAHSLGIVLDVGEISLIAENIGTSTDSLEQDIDAIESAIMAFVEHKAMISQQKINQMVSSVRRTVQHKNSENSQLLTDGLRSINSDIQEANKDFKSNVKKALSAFAIPAIKAG